MNVNEDWLVSLSVTETDGQTHVEARLVMSGGDRDRRPRPGAA